MKNVSLLSKTVLFMRLLRRNLLFLTVGKPLFKLHDFIVFFVSTVFGSPEEFLDLIFRISNCLGREGEQRGGAFLSTIIILHKPVLFVKHSFYFAYWYPTYSVTTFLPYFFLLHSILLMLEKITTKLRIV